MRRRSGCLRVPALALLLAIAIPGCDTEDESMPFLEQASPCAGEWQTAFDECMATVAGATCEGGDCGYTCAGFACLFAMAECSRSASQRLDACCVTQSVMTFEECVGTVTP